MAANLPKLTDANFKEVINSGKLVIVDFNAPWCGPCKKLDPIFTEIANENSDKAEFYSCNVEEAQNIALEYSILSVPTIGIFKDGNLLEAIVGLKPKDKLIKTFEKFF